MSEDDPMFRKMSRAHDGRLTCSGADPSAALRFQAVSQFVGGGGCGGKRVGKELWDVERCQRHLARLDERIEAMLAECEAVDAQEGDQGSLVQLKETLQKKEKLKAKIAETLETLQSEGIERLNTTDSDSVPIHGRQGSGAGYNAQIVVDDQHGLIVHGDVVNDNNDLGQFAEQITAANAMLERPCQTACADAGYSKAAELEKIDAKEIDVIVPAPQQVRGKKPKPFDKSHFRYDVEQDAYICPAGIRLPFRRVNGPKEQREYYPGRGVCDRCEHFGTCTTNVTTGRKIIRDKYEAFRERLAAHYKEPSAQAVYARRKEKVELPFGRLKHNLGVSCFLLRGLAGVRAEMSLLASGFNVTRLIGLFGVAGLTAKLAAQ